MNAEPNDTLSVAITGVLTIGQRELEQIIARLVTVSPVVIAPSLKLPQGGENLARMSYSVKQTADLLGVSKTSVYRLLERGLLRSSCALRTKVIPRSEIERFLKETTRSSY